MALSAQEGSSRTAQTVPGRGPRPTPGLPARIADAIRAQEERSEIMITWVQLAIVLIFGAFYAVAPRPADSGAQMFEPAPAFLAGYFLLTLGRMALAYGRLMTTWLVHVSTVIDMALLMGLIWSFHLQYGQPPSFYLKAPTLLYVFIFIALRALRFDPRFVLSAGLVGAAGWLFLLVYAVAADPELMPITRDYVEYITSAKILIGAEIDKLLSIVIVTLILTVALVRARDLLILAVRQGTAADDLKRFFAPETARTITGGDRAVAPGEGELRDAAILMVDIRDFTRFAATIPPHAVVRQLGGYQAHILPVIQRHNGVVDKFLGDGIMASFGAAAPSRTAAADALRCVEALLEAAAAWNAERAAEGFAEPLAVNAAVAVGRVVYGAVGDDTRLEYTVIGDAVNLAAKLEKHNKTEGVAALTTRVTYESALAQGYAARTPARPLPARDLVGVDRPQDLVVLA
ncbi:MAG: adenylate/guanylate cyclase domain-containing protein [Inquilinaceae bacterium]